MIISNKTSVAARVKVTVESLLPCSCCGEDIPASASVCPECGGDPFASTMTCPRCDGESGPQGFGGSGLSLPYRRCGHCFEERDVETPFFAVRETAARALFLRQQSSPVAGSPAVSLPAAGLFQEVA